MWFERFRVVTEDFSDDEKSGSPITSRTDRNVEKVTEMARNYRRLTVSKISELNTKKKLRD
jgi:hypothetical protein